MVYRGIFGIYQVYIWWVIMVDEMPKHLKQFIMYGEGTTCKFKMAKNRSPSNLFETICVMLNRNGGNIF